MAKKTIISQHATGFNYFCAIFVGIGSLLWGYDSGIFGTAQAQDYFETFFHPSPTMLGAIISTYTAGGAVGCLFSWPIGKRLGRMGTLRIGAVISIIGTALQTAAQDVGLLIAGRLIAGLAIGIIYFAIPQYQAEIAPPEHRGSIVGLHAQFIGLGYAVSNWLGYGVYFAKGQFTYRFPVGLQVLWGLILLACTFFLPESPRYLVSKGRTEEAFQVLKKFRRSDQGEYLKKEFIQMREQITFEQEHEETSIIALFSKQSYRRRILLGSGVQIGQQICGISAINYYQTIMYKSLGIQGSTVLLLAGVWGILGPLSNFFGLLLIFDRVKRRTLLIWGALAMAVDIAIVMAIVAAYGGSSNKVANGFGVFFLLVFDIIFSISWNSGAPIYCSEIFPQQIRTAGGGIATFWSFVIQVILAQASPVALNQVHWRYYIFFVVTNIVTAGCVWYWLPETSSRTLEEIDEVFGDNFVAAFHMDEKVDEAKLDETIQVEDKAARV